MTEDKNYPPLTASDVAEMLKANIAARAQRRRKKSGEDRNRIVVERLTLDECDPAKRRKQLPPGHRTRLPYVGPFSQRPPRPDDER